MRRRRTVATTPVAALLVLALAGAACAQDATRPAPQWRLVAWFPTKEAAQERAASLRATQRRFANLGVRVRLLLPPTEIDDARLDDVFDEVLDAGTDFATQRIVVETAGGRVLWGAPDLEDAADVLAHVTTDPNPDERLAGLDLLVRLVEFYVPEGPASPEASARLVQTMPTSPRARALQYIDTLWNRADRPAARALADAAFPALAADGWATTSFCDLVLRSDGHEHATARRIETVMRDVAAAAPVPGKAWLVWLRAALRRDPQALSGVDVAARFAALRSRPELVLEFAEILASRPLPPEASDALQTALQRLAPDLDRQVYLVRAKQALTNGDAAAASELVRWLAAPGRPGDANRSAWELLTRPETMGRFDAVALALMQGLRDGGKAMPPEYQDTLALALYGTGAAEVAAAREAEVVAADPDDPRYEIRRRRFASAPKPDDERR